ncbi:hypothetical protein [Domibacillus antri]|nr:hypothetical protein [Domibacillus antri]
MENQYGQTFAAKTDIGADKFKSNMRKLFSGDDELYLMKWTNVLKEAIPL